jgi:hypothetical protein
MKVFSSRQWSGVFHMNVSLGACPLVLNRFGVGYHCMEKAVNALDRRLR